MQTYYINERDISSIRINLKLKPCPHCGMIGMLILHDFIYGYDEFHTQHKKKGKRVFCSNRNKRKGCGRTLLYLIIDFIKRTLISSFTAWHFLLLILSGMSVEKAYNSLDPECILSLSTFYYFWKRFKLQNHMIRTYLANHLKLKDNDKSCPYRETIEHLSNLSENELNPIAQYQKTFQSSFI